MENSNIKKVKKNIVWSFIGQLITYGVGILIPRLIIVSYGSEINGLTSSVGTVISYITLLEAGIGSVTCQQLYKPIAEKNRDRINQIISTTNYYYRRTGFWYIIIVAALTVSYPLIVKSDYSFLFVAAVVLIAGVPGIVRYMWIQKYNNVLETDGKKYIINNSNTLFSTVSSVVKAFLLYIHTPILLVLFISLLITLLQTVYIYIYIRKNYSWLDVHAEKDFSAFTEKNGAFVHQVCGMITSGTDVLVLTVFSDLISVSIYSIYSMVFNIISSVSTTVNSSISFLLGQSYHKGKEYYCKILDVYESIYVGMTSVFFTVTYILIIPFLRLYTAGSDVDYINKILPVLFLLTNLLNAFRISSLNTISFAGKFDATKKHAITESVINLAVSIISVNIWGLPGVLVGTVIAFTYRCIVAISFSNKKILNRKATHIIKIMISDSLMIALCSALLMHVGEHITNYFNFVLFAVPIFIIVAVLFVLLNIIVDKSTCVMVWDLFKKKYFKKRK